MKKIYSFCSIACITLAFATQVDAQQSMFTRVYFDNAGSTQAWASMKTFDHNYLLGGYKDQNPMALKADTLGNILWAKTIGTTGDFYALTPTADSCFVLAGRLYDTPTLDFQLFCVKITANGDTVWTRFLNMGVGGYFNSVQTTSDGGYILAGNIYAPADPHRQGVVVKLASDGAVEWSESISDGTSSTFIYSVKELPGNSYIVTGTRGTDIPFQNRMFLMKLLPAGAISWSLSHDTPYPVSSEGLDVIVASDGLFLLNSASSDGMRLTKTDFSGTMLWGKKYSTYNFQDALTQPRLHRTSDGGFVFVDGATYGPGWILKTDSAGNASWSQQLFINTADVLEADDKGYIVTGNGPVIGVEMTETLNPQIGLIKMDSAGNSISCVYGMGANSFPDTVVFVSYPFTATEGGTLISSHPVVGESVLEAGYGCVAFLGAVADSPKEEDLLGVYPNPSAGIFRVELNQGTISGIEVYNAMNQMVYSDCNPGTVQTSVNLGSAPNGLYFIRAKAGTRVYSQKILINR
jgi:hypothetical protein